MDYGRFFLAGAGWLIGAIVGAAVWAQRAATKAGARSAGGEDELIQTVQVVGGNSIGAALQGAFVGGIIGLILALAYLYFSDPERGLNVRKQDTGDDWGTPTEDGKFRLDE